MPSTTPLYYASISGLTGICFTIGASVLFAPCEGEGLHLVDNRAALVVTAQVPDLFARFLRETVVYLQPADNYLAPKTG